MNWTIEFKKIFLKELVKLPIEVREKIEETVFTESIIDNPFEIFSLEKMSGYIDKYKIRFGNYRVGMILDNKLKKIIFSRVAHRKDIYKIFP